MAILILSMSFLALRMSNSQVPGFNAQHTIRGIDPVGSRSADPAAAPAGRDAAVPQPPAQDSAGAASGSPEGRLLRSRS
ncbi:MAG TPA: hypothetical protein VNW71_09275 [Thermoanaerobaculia bacterium]|nr:hypothetical protein [Thermoanaerobaculia bacterium]